MKKQLSLREEYKKTRELNTTMAITTAFSTGLLAAIVMMLLYKIPVNTPRAIIAGTSLAVGSFLSLKTFFKTAKKLGILGEKLKAQKQVEHTEADPKLQEVIQKIAAELTK